MDESRLHPKTHPLIFCTQGSSFLGQHTPGRGWLQRVTRYLFLRPHLLFFCVVCHTNHGNDLICLNVSRLRSDILKSTCLSAQKLNLPPDKHKHTSTKIGLNLDGRMDWPIWTLTEGWIDLYLKRKGYGRKNIVIGNDSIVRCLVTLS